MSEATMIPSDSRVNAVRRTALRLSEMRHMSDATSAKATVASAATTARERGKAGGAVRRVLIRQFREIHQPLPNALTRRTVAAVVADHLAKDNGDYVERGLEHATSQPCGTERRHRDQCDPVGWTGMSGHWVPPDAKRHVGEANRKFPVLSQEAPMRRIDQLGRGGRWLDEAVGDHRYVPACLGIALAQAFFEIRRQVPGQLGRQTGGSDQPDGDLRLRGLSRRGLGHAVDGVGRSQTSMRSVRLRRALGIHLPFRINRTPIGPRSR